MYRERALNTDPHLRGHRTDRCYTVPSRKPPQNPREARLQLSHRHEKIATTTDLSEDTRVETLTQSQRLYEHNNNSINAAQPQTSNAPCDVWRAEKTCRAKHMASTTMPINKNSLAPPHAHLEKLRVSPRSFWACFKLTDQLLEKTRTLKQSIASSAPQPAAICYMALHATNKREHDHKKVKGRKTTNW